MSLETKLTEMGDPGRFEKLSTEILRWSNKKYRSVIQTGVNTEGKPIRDPVDGLGQAPDANPPHFVFLEFTTTKKSGLERKWLANPDPETDKSKGDLIKAAEQAEDIREDVPHADFTVVLVSNRVLDSDLMRAVFGTASSFDISVDVWDVHRLAGFLQTDPNGQYLRSKYFGIDEERLSEPLLLELSNDSLRSYEESFRIPVDTAKVERPEQSTIIESARSSGMESYFIPIVGNSGFGKTVICHQVMEQWRADEKPTLRLDSEDIENAKTLAQALQSGLTRLQPSLESTAGQKAIQLAQDTSQLLIVVDDLNRADNPSQLLSQLQNWMGGAREVASDGSGNGESADIGGLPVTILCPLWPRIWAKQKRNINQNKFAKIIELGPLSAEKAGHLIQAHADAHGHDFTDEKALSLAEKVGRDPHLIGLLGQLMHTKDTIDDLPDTSKEVLDEYSEYAYETATEASDGSLIVPDYERAVEELSLGVMENKNLAPTWREVCDLSWSTSQTLDGIRTLSNQEQIFSILKQRSDRILSFRHDRIRDFLLAESSLSEIERTGNIPACLTDPYYYSIIGVGIAFFRPSEAILSELREKNPIALLESLRRLGGEAPEYEQKVGTEFQQWLDEQEDDTEIPNSMLGEIMDNLQQTDSKQVLKIADFLPQFPPVLLARFRNGDLEAGIQYCTGGRGGQPSLNNPQRDSVFADAMQQNGNRYTHSLSEVLSSVEGEHVQATLRLAGFFGRSELGPALKNCWENHCDDPELLPAFLWATFQCCIPEHRDLVDQVVGQWASLPSGNSIDDTTVEFGAGDVYSEIQHSLTQDISADQVQYLIEAADEFTGVDNYITSLLSRLPDPDALEFVVKKRAENMQETDKISPWAMSLLDHWSPSHLRGDSLPLELKGRMKEVWMDDEKIDEMRTSAFQLWARNAEENNLEELKRASENDLFEYTAYYHRMRLGDVTAVTSNSIDFEKRDTLLKPLSNVWGSEAYSLVDSLINDNSPGESGNLFHSLGDILFRIPPDDAEQLLDTHWKKVKKHSKFFQAALYTGTSLTEELARAVYEDSDDPEGLLNHIGMNFGFNTSGKSQLITEQHLKSLEPYISDIPNMDLIGIVEKADELGMKDWAANHVQPHLPNDQRPRHFPTNDDFIEELNEIKDNDNKDIRGWMTRFDQRSISKSRVFGVLEEWLQTNPTLETYRISVEVVKNWGTREELKILDDISIEDESAQRFYKDAEFGVKVRTLN
ncbi:NACHT domain-containing protein [Halorussus salinus]|uniref:ATP-binding protein n=1 Tax=Halorussus salinus TaxID=1364935 RepID=UPI0010921E0C|nr:ATP-binding protein [Halorussus salinus]